MLKDVDFKVVYSSGEDEPAEFFLDALMESSIFNLGLGFFSTSGFRALSIGFAFFIKRGGKMRIIINDVLSPEDKDAIEKGLISNPDELIEQRIIEDIVSLEKTLSGSDRHFFDCISWLIATKMLEIVAIAPSNNRIGIAHQKFGVFEDSTNNKVAFSGSANFSSNAMFYNIESLSCYKSWTGEVSENARMQYFENIFHKTWSGKSDVVRIIPIEKVKTNIRNSFPVHDIQELIDAELNMLSNAPAFPNSISFKLKLEALRDKLGSTRNNKPTFPSGMTPLDYQIHAYEEWRNSNYVGFFEMATGTGKTVTSLNCALKLCEFEKKYQLLIIVPTLPLADQWIIEAESFGFKNIILANSKNSNWVESAMHELNKSFLDGHSYCIITTYQTFNLDKFQSIISKLDETTLLIADEAHNFGTVRTQKNFPTKFKRRIGLSATPERHFDEIGTKALLSFFNALEQPTFSLGMQEAIDKGYLCPYYYYPKIVTLTDKELDEYKEISKRLLKYFDKKGGRFQDNPTVSALLLKRKRIIQKAHNKLDTFRECIKELMETRDALKYMLVYVPEGKSSGIDAEDKNLINEYSEVISKEFGLPQHQYIGMTANRDDVLRRFSQGRISALTAMKCLDEGVDVKRTEIAIFCASTSNPRQFIQRRGRILRKHPDKKFAYIYDMVVVPEISTLYFEETISMEKAILSAELKRVYEFASMGVNKYQSLKTLEDTANMYDIDIFSTKISGVWQ